MEIKKIGFDIDDTLTDTVEYILEQFKLYCDNIIHEPFNGRYLPYKYNYEEKFPGYDSLVMRKFNNWYFPRMIKDVPFRKGSAELFKELQDLHYEVVIVTRRDDHYSGIFSGELMKAYTLDNFKKNNLNPDKFYFASFNKRDTMNKNNIDILVEDSIPNIQQVSINYPVIIMDNPWNISYKENEKSTFRIKDFNIENFINIIRKVENQ